MPVFTVVVAAVSTAIAWYGGLTVLGQAAVQIGAGLVLNKLASAGQGSYSYEPPPLPTGDGTKPPSARRASVAAVRKFGISGTLGRGVDIPQSFIAGTYATAGSLVWGEEWGSSNEYLTQVIEVSNLPVRGLAGIFIDGEEVTIESTQVHTDFGSRLRVQHQRLKKL